MTRLSQWGSRLPAAGLRPRATPALSPRGTPITLTWSIVPDGTTIIGDDEPTSGSDLRNRLDGIYPGGIDEWLPLFQSVFDRWEELTGITYVYEPNDDGSQISGGSAPGVLGVRGDVRISGHPIDGNSNTLAYNYFPNNGDMVIDTADSFYNSTFNNSLRFRNVVSHEHGHGLGLAHSCPINTSKLMEPFLTTAFDGPQLDDILGAQRNYGDALEGNDTQATASDLGAIAADSTEALSGVSIDDNGDTDYYRFTSSSGSDVQVTINLTPTGGSYLAGAQNNDGSCSGGTIFNADSIHDLTLRLRDSSGTVIATANSGSNGDAESISNLVLNGAGPFFVQVNGDATNNIQGYSLSITTEAINDGFFVLSAASTVIAEDAGTATLTVLRQGDSTGAASISYATSDGSGVAGIDYTATNGTLNFIADQTSATIGVPIIDNQQFSGDRTFSLSLSDPSAGFGIGLPSQNVVTIQENDSTGIYEFENNATVTNSTDPDLDTTSADIYPSTIEVSGTFGSIIDVSAEIDGLTHGFPRDIDLLLVSPTGKSIMLISDAGGSNTNPANGVDIIFNDAGASLGRNTTLTQGSTYAPVDLEAGSDTMPAPAPAGPYQTSFGILDGDNPEGTWSLYFADDFPAADGGSFTGWKLTFVTDQAVPPSVAPFELLSLTRDQNVVTVSFPSQPGIVYQLERTDDLEIWEIVQEDVTSAGGGEQFLSDTPPAGRRWFYRVTGIIADR